MQECFTKYLYIPNICTTIRGRIIDYSNPPLMKFKMAFALASKWHLSALLLSKLFLKYADNKLKCALTSQEYKEDKLDKYKY